MKIELRAFKEHKRLSEETVAFSADLYLNGAKIGTAENTGKGGCNMLSIPHSLEQQMSAWALTLPAVESRYGSLPMNLDLYISCLVEREGDRADVKRLMRNRVLVLEANGTISQSKVLTPEQMVTVRASWAAKGMVIATEESAIEAMLKG